MGRRVIFLIGWGGSAVPRGHPLEAIQVNLTRLDIWVMPRAVLGLKDRFGCVGMQVWGGDVSQDHLLGQPDRAQEVRNLLQEGWFQGASWQGGQSMVSPQARSASQVSGIPTSRAPSLASMTLAFLATPTGGPPSPSAPASLRPQDHDPVSVERFPALVHLVPLLVQVPPTSSSLWPALSPGSTGNPFSSQRLPFRPIKISDFECQFHVVVLAGFHVHSFLPKSSLTASSCHSPPLAAPQMLSGSL